MKFNSGFASSTIYHELYHIMNTHYKVCLYSLVLCFFMSMSVSLAQIPADRTSTVTMFEDYKPGIVYFTSGNVSKQSKLNIFLKNSTLVFKRENVVMEAMMSTVKSVKIENRLFLNHEDCLYEVLAYDSVSDVHLLRLHLIDIETSHSEALTSSVIDNLDYNSNSRAINMIRSDVQIDSYPTMYTYFFLIRNKKLLTAEERTVRTALTREQRSKFNSIINYDFRWSDPQSLAKLLKLFVK